MKSFFFIIITLSSFSIYAQITNTPLAGKPIEDAPWFTFINNFQEVDTVYVGIDSFSFPELVNQTINVFIIESRIPDSLIVNPFLEDVRGNPQEVTIGEFSVYDNTFLLEQSYLLNSQSGNSLGVGYDIILDVDNNFALSPGDIIDGWDDHKAGFYKVHNTAEPGPFTVVAANYDDPDPWLDKLIFHPANIEFLGELPLIIVSHGWTYNYLMYDYIGEHLASYGYIVVIHANDVGSGGPAATHSASLTTLDNTDHFIGAQGSVLNGIFEGHIDQAKIAFLGHSTGGEGIVRAYTRVMNNEYYPEHFELDDIKLLCPFAPVAWLTKLHVDPGSTNFHMFSAAADTDCSLFACPEYSYQQSFAIFERSTGNRQLTYIHGAGHTNLNGCGDACNQWIDPQAPGLIGEENTHLVVKSYLLPLVELYLNNNPAGEEYFTRMYDDFHPVGIPDSIYLAKEFRSKQNAYKLVIDDFQTNFSLNESSSGTSVSYNMENIDEIEMRDNDQSFNWTGNQPSNGFTRSKLGDEPRCVIFDWNNDEPMYYQIEVPEIPDSIRYEFLSFRACQGTRHPNTETLNGGISFMITLQSNNGAGSSVFTSNYGLINQPYQRSEGWTNEFETIIIRLSDFSIVFPDLNIHDLASIRFVFTQAGHSPTGRLAIDDIELVGESETFTTPFTTEINSLSDDSKVQVYPNPVTDVMIISGVKKEDEIVITNQMGQLIEIIPNNGNKVQYDMERLKPGLYLLHFLSENRHRIEKIIKL